MRDGVLDALHPARGGLLHPDRLTFGQPLELGEVLAAAQGVPGVLAVSARRFRSLRAPRGVCRTKLRAGTPKAGQNRDGKTRVLLTYCGASSFTFPNLPMRRLA